MSAAPPTTAEPESRSKSRPSGRLLLRMPAALHAELAQAAEREGVSLNQFITGALARTIGWGGADDAGRAASAAPPPRASRLIAAALVANVVVIGLAAVAAIAILVLAWRGS